MKDGKHLSELFVRNGNPTLLYVEPAQARRIRNSLQTLGSGLVIEGPSKAGKTTALREELKRLNEVPVWLDAYSHGDEIRATIDQRRLDGHTVIDNAHALPNELLPKLARWLRIEPDAPAPRGKITLICIPGTTRRLVAMQRDLGGRFDAVLMKPQPPEKILELVDRGEILGGIRFAHKAEIVSASRGSFQLAQILCYECAIESGVERFPAKDTTIDRSVEDVRGEIQQGVSAQFDDLALAFARADADTPTPGAGLATLWMLSRSMGNEVAFATLRNKYPALSPAWAFWARGGLREVAQLSKDPLFHFYLQGLDWNEFSERAGIAIAWDGSSGELLVPVSASQSGQATFPQWPRNLYEQRSFPLWLPDAVTLRDLLVRAYPDVAQIVALANMVEINTGNFTPSGGAAEPAWTSMLQLATQQMKLEALMNKVLSDPNARSYRGAICGTLKNLGVSAPGA